MSREIGHTLDEEIRPFAGGRHDIGEGFAFFRWVCVNYEKYAQWHKGRRNIWVAWWTSGRH